MAVKTWVWIVVAVVGVGLLGILALAGAGMYFVATRIDTQSASRTTAERTFEEARAPFAAEKPLLDIDDSDRPVRVEFDRFRRAGSKRPETLHVLAFDGDEGRIVRVRVPFWFLRLKSGPIEFMSGRDADIDFGDLAVTVEDLDRAGPALILDHTTREGDRVLVWSQ